MAQSLRPGFGATPYEDGGGTGVTFRVWAPNATSVAVPGTFNGWSTSAFPLTAEGATGIWSADSPVARPGDQYKFHLNGNLWKRDPRGRLVEHTAGNSIVYDQGAFDWQGDVPIPIDLSDLVIYEMHIGAFHDPAPANGLPGTFADAIQRLDHLADLGVNAVELLPIAEFPGDYSWGYNPADPFAVENVGYGGPDGLKAFVQACHARGIAVFTDIVHNHYGPSDLELWEFDGFSGLPNGGGIYFYQEDGKCCTSWGARPNYSRPEVRAYIRDNFEMWLKDYHLDGFRWDTPGTMRFYDAGNGSYPELPEATSLIIEITTLTSTGYPGAINMAEDAGAGLGFDSEWDRSFRDTLEWEMTKTSDADRSISALLNAVNATGFGGVLFSEMHDSVGSLNPGARRLPVAIDTGAPEGYWARKRSTLAAGFVLTSPGIPMLFMGQEFLAVQPFNDHIPLDWQRTNTFSDVLRFYKDLVHLRRNLDGVSGGLMDPNVSFLAADSSNKVLAWRRWGGATEDEVVVVINASANTHANYTLGFPQGGPWFVNFNSDLPKYGSDYSGAGDGYVVATGSPSASADLVIGPYAILVLSKLAHPDLDADGDGLPNGWEQLHFNDPLIASPGDDPDEDGVLNGDEFGAGTDPQDGGSFLRFTEATIQGDQVRIDWIGGSAATQVVSLSTNGLAGMPWEPLYTNVPPTPVTNSILVDAPAAGPGAIRIEASP